MFALLEREVPRVAQRDTISREQALGGRSVHDGLAGLSRFHQHSRLTGLSCLHPLSRIAEGKIQAIEEGAAGSTLRMGGRLDLAAA
jgi:hypothetical protein